MNRKRRGLSLTELVLVMAIGAVLTLVTGMALSRASKVFSLSAGRDNALRNLSRAHRALETDLSLVSLEPNHFQITTSPATHGGGADGDAIDFLSAVNITDDNHLVTLTDGSANPYSFQNVVYYITTPSNHDALFQTTCTGGNEGGYDYNCPHKVLLRSIVDQNATFDPSDPSSQDTLLTLPGSFLSRPTNFPRTATLSTVAANLLTFQIQRNGAELVVTLKAVAIQDAARRVGIGNVSFNTGPYTIEQRFSVFPKN